MALLILLSALIHYSNAVFGGRYAMQSEVTSMASVRSLHSNTPQGMRSFCGGTLIAPRTVITAAHCVWKEGQFPIVVDVAVNDYDVYSTEPQEQKGQTKAIDLLPNYVKTLDVQDDIAILYLPSTVDHCKTFDGATVARLPPSSHSQLIPADPLLAYYNTPLTDDEVYTFSFCSFSSWGMIENGNYSRLPMNMAVTLQKSSEPNSFVAKTSYGRFCLGDSGSPVFCTIRGVSYLVGIISEIGSYDQSKIAEYEKMTTFEKCSTFDHAKVVDVRKRIPDIQQIMKMRGMEQHLAKGQRDCKYN